MTVEFIHDTVAALKARYHTQDPEELCEHLGYFVSRQSLGTTKNAVKGCAMLMDGMMILLISLDQSENMQRVVLAHELGHALLHPDVLGVLDNGLSFTAYDPRFGTEYEANLFAAELLLDDRDVLDALHENGTAPGAAADLGILPGLMELKLRSLHARGQISEPPIIYGGNFLRRAAEEDSASLYE